MDKYRIHFVFTDVAYKKHTTNYDSKRKME